MIVEQYVHTLIPNDPRFSPTAEQIVHFLEGLSALGAAPLNPELLVLKPSGRLRTFSDPMTGETRSFPANDRVTVKSTADLAPTIDVLQHYYVALEGQGPPRLPPFPLYFEDAPVTRNYGFTAACCLRPEPVSMSDLGDEQTEGEIPSFGEACTALRGTALFRHPATEELIEVTDAGCARFWVEFEFGKWLLPHIGSSLEILDPTITELATVSFALPFAQGFHHL
jgi:hypothetical protein